MRLHTVFTIHKITGLALGAILLLLGFTGFFLDHDNFDFLWDIKVSDKLLPESIVQKKLKAFNAYKIDSSNPRHIITGSRMGLFTSLDAGVSFQKTLDQQVLAIEPERTNQRENFQILYAATSNGIYKSRNGGLQWTYFALKNKVVDSFSLFDGQIYAVVDKRDVYQIDLKSKIIEKLFSKEFSKW